MHPCAKQSEACETEDACAPGAIVEQIQQFSIFSF